MKNGTINKHHIENLGNYVDVYTYRKKGPVLWFNSFYEILFDEDVIHIVDTKAQSINICKLLNGAYTLGFMAGLTSPPPNGVYIRIK